MKETVKKLDVHNGHEIFTASVQFNGFSLVPNAIFIGTRLSWFSVDWGQLQHVAIFYCNFIIIISASAI